MHSSHCIIGGCRKKPASIEVSPTGRYCKEHERQRVYEDLLGGNVGKVRAWEEAQATIRDRERLARLKEERAAARELRPKKAPRPITDEVRAARAAYERRRRKKVRLRRRRKGLCPCGRKPAKGRRNCRRCVLEKHPPGKPRIEDKKQLSKRQKVYYRKHKRAHVCVHCTKEAFWDGYKGRFLSACIDHLTKSDSSRLAKLMRRADERLEKLARGEKIPVRDIEDTGDIEAGEALLVTDNESALGEIAGRSPRR